MPETVLITGISGQDGSLLSRKLISEGKNVVGTFRRGNSSPMWRLDEMSIKNKVQLIELDLQDQYGILKLLDKYEPEKIYHLAADGFVADSFNHPKKTFDSNINTTLNILESLRYRNSKIWTFLASSSEVYSGLEAELINELNSYKTINPYGLSKLVCLELADIYSNIYGLNIASGIFFNHESPWRAKNYVTRKISFNIARMKKGFGNPFNLGNLETSRDWSSAEDFIVALSKLGDLKSTGKFIFASGRKCLLRDFVKEVCKAANFEPLFVGNGVNEICKDKRTGNVICRVDKKYFRPLDTKGKIGDASKLKKEVNWSGSRSIQEIAKSMLYSDLTRI